MTDIPDALQKRFWQKVEKTDTCWNWTATKLRGYGRYTAGGKNYGAHRLAYEMLIGPIPDGLQLDHLCRNPSCVNPAHLEPVTARENTVRSNGITAMAARRTECPSGHPYAGENLYVLKNGRYCRECDRVKQRRKYPLFSRAFKELGLSQREYGRQYGWSKAVAIQILTDRGIDLKAEGLL